MRRELSELWRKIWPEVLGIVTFLLLILLCSSCSMSLPWSTPEVVAEVPKQTATAELISTASDGLWKFGWMSILLVLFFPKVREPILGLWTALLGAIAIPFLADRQWFDGVRRP